MILIIDNYDSFTYNLVQYLGELGAVLEVFRNDEITVTEAEKLNPTHIVISPGPCTPIKAGVSKEIIRFFCDKVPILGVCLGHQAIGEVFGGKVIRAPFPVHGKVSRIHHDGKSIFKNLKNPFGATRYHSLIVEKEGLPECLSISARTEDGLIMGLRHNVFQVEGVQFHPESIKMKPHG
ncbi:MAG: aminodeoxychorismate/anthranilate synthase component II, partial [Actinomycetia bacterium]|nr:aminodeoxychorismate/anthranilate synthase component II [Actinomycetes bacterium]